MRVLIVRLGSMGDVLHALPAVVSLRAAYPDAHIGWAIERRWTPFLVADGTPFAGQRSAQRPLVDYVHVVDTLGWRRAPFSDATWSDVRDTFRDLRAERYDVAIDFQGSIKSAVVAQFSGATSRIGFAQPREKPATMLYTHVVQPTGVHIIDRNLSLAASSFPLRTPASLAVNDSSIGNRQSTVGNVFPVDGAAESEAERNLAAIRASQTALRFAILNPGAGWPAKQWPASRYAEVARALKQDGILSLVNHGPNEGPLAREVGASSDGAAHPIQCSLPELIALTRRASLFIGGDTGPMHLAALLGVPIVALFGPTDPARNGPYSFASKSRIENQQSKMVVVLRHPASRTTTAHAAHPDPGLSQISAGEVIAAARDLLTRKSIAESREPLS